MITTRISQLPVGSLSDVADDAHVVMNSTANPTVSTVRLPVGTLKEYVSVSKTIVTLSDDGIAENNTLYLVDLSAKTLMLTLPASATNEGFEITVKILYHGGSDSLNIMPDGSDTIDSNAGKLTLTKDWAWLTIVATSTQGWMIINGG